MYTPQRDEKGRLLPGSQLAKGIKIPYTPRTSSRAFKNLARELIDMFDPAYVFNRMKSIEDDTQFMVIYNKFLEEANKADNNEFRNQLELMKIERESSPDDDNNIIEISFTSPGSDE